MLNPVVVFQQIAQAGRAGRVDFESGPTKHQFYLAQGQIVYAVSSDPYYSLDAYLLRRQSLSKLDQKFVRTRAQEELKPVEAILEAQGLVPHGELANVMSSLVREIAYDLFSWTDGDYSVSNDEVPPQGALLVDFPLDGVLEKGRQVHDKWRKLSGKVPKLEVVLHRSAHTVQPEAVEISPEEWQILAAVDDVRNVYEICYELSPNRLQILSRIARLLEKDLLEVLDFKDRTRPGGLGTKGLKYSTVSTVFRNVLSVLLERVPGTGAADGARKLAQAAQAVAAKGHPGLTGLTFDAKNVFDAQALLHSFCFVGQSGDLKSVLRGLSLHLQQTLSELKGAAPQDFDLAVADMRAMLGIAEELLPDFHLSLHTAVEKALLGEPLPPGAGQAGPVPAAAPEAWQPGPQPIPTALALPQEAATSEMPVMHHYSDTEHTALVPQGAQGLDAPTEEVDPEAVERVLTAGPLRTEVKTPPERPMPAPVRTPPERLAPVQARQQPVQPPVPPVERKEDAGPAKTAKRKAVSADDAGLAQPPEEVAAAREKPRVKQREDEATAADEVEEESPGGRKALVVILVLLVVLLMGAIGVGGYVLATNKQLRVRLQRMLRPAKPQSVVLDTAVDRGPLVRGLPAAWRAALSTKKTGAPPWSDA